MIKDLTGIAKPCPMCGSKRIYMPFPTVDVVYSVKIQCADCGLNGYNNDVLIFMVNHKNFNKFFMRFRWYNNLLR